MKRPLMGGCILAAFTTAAPLWTREPLGWWTADPGEGLPGVGPGD